MKIGFMQGRLSPIYKNKIQSFPWNYWKKEIEIAKKNSYNLMEWTLDYPNLKYNPIISSTKDTFHFLKKNRLKVESVTCDFFMQKPFFKNHSTKDLYFILNKLQKTKIKKIIIPLVDNSSLKNKKDIRNVIRKFKEINIFFKKKFIFLFESDFKPQKLQKFIKQFPIENFGINYDVGNSASLNYSLNEEFNLYAKYIKNIHLKDRILNGKTIRFGKGNVNFKKFFKLIKRYKYKDNLILQPARHKKFHLKELKLNEKYINQFI